MKFLRGQSLIELLIAMTVIIVGLTSATTMIFSNVRLQERSGNRVETINLAREGIELAKAHRDSNWLAGVPFDTGFYDPSTLDFTATPNTDGGTFAGFNFAGSLGFLFGAPYEPELYMKASDNPASPGLITQGTGVTGAATQYLRILVFNPICADGVVITADTTDCTGHGAKVGIHIISVVASVSRDVETTVVEDDLYDWR